MESTNNEAELDSFRQRWREEVSARNARYNTTVKQQNEQKQAQRVGQPSRSVPGVGTVSDPELQDDVEPYAYHDLENREEYLKLGNEALREKAKDKEPVSALEHYEKAVEREAQGKLGDSVSLYRKAFKLDFEVHEVYKNKHFPPSAPSAKPANRNPSNAPATVPNPAHHSSEGSKANVSDLIASFAELAILQAEPETSISAPPPCPISSVPEELLVKVFMLAGFADVATYSRLAQVCKRFAYLVATENSLWKPIAIESSLGFPSMHYQYACDLHGYPIPNVTGSLESVPSQPLRDLTPSVYPSYREQFRRRPRIRFNGCYISTTNYQRAGAPSQSQLTWNNPIHIVTYHRYLRFFRDGTVISLLTTAEPADVVHHFTKENLHGHHGGRLPPAVMKDTLRGRWRLSGGVSLEKTDDSDDDNEDLRGPGEYRIEPNHGHNESEGDLLIETDGVIPKYMWKMQFNFASAGRRDGTRNNKLAWKGFWRYDRLTGAWDEFNLRNDGGYYWSRVKSYGFGE